MAKNIRIFSPLDGKFLPLRECINPVLASGAIGRGITIKNPVYGVFAPFGGVVTLFFPIGYGIGLKSNDGIEIFIHIGIDNEEMNCEEITAEVKVGEIVKTGQLLLRFTPKAIKKAIYNSATAVVVTNHEKYGNITFELGSQSITVKADNYWRLQRRINMEETKFTILGESESGKTCYLLAMYSAMSQSIDGYSIVAKDDRLDTELLEAFYQLDDESISKERFPQRSEQTIEYLFNLNYAHKTIMPFKWIDYPGRIMRDKTDEDYPKVAQNIRESSTLFICVDGNLLVGDDKSRKTKNVKRKCSMTINRYLGKYFEAGGHLPPVGIILTKSDLFMHDTSEDEIREIVAEAFSPLFFAKNIKIGVIPVTLGENIADDNYSGEVDPINIHLPIFMGIFFALNENIAAYKYKIESNNRSINDMDYWKRDEEDSFFIWRDDDKIRRLSAQISNTTKENERLQQLVQSMEQNKSKFDDYLNQIMWFIDGSWRI